MSYCRRLLHQNCLLGLYHHSTVNCVMAHLLKHCSLLICCARQSCLRNLKDIPERVSNLPWEQLYYEPDAECCGKPTKNPETLDFLMDIEDDYANDLMDNGYICCYPGNNQAAQCFYKVKKRCSTRIGGNSYRKNIIHAVFFMPDVNCYASLHQTYRYCPRGIEIENLLKRIFQEALPRVQSLALQDGFLGNFCTCSGC